jgi:2-polyprenyl-3-methyl-5-hydroxy-6-metoxy-1,4-benzoquinol methylase/glycosyltransferase involved in cell wall biosynthesis
MSCSALVYPTEFEEVSCITAMEAMASGLPFISSEHAALPETCKDSGSILIPLKNGAADEDQFVETLLTFEQGFGGDAHKAYIEAQREAVETRTWEHAVDVLEAELQRIFAERSKSPARMARHLIEHSDIRAAQELQLVDGDAIAKAALSEIGTMYAFAKSLDATVAHYQKWEGMNCDRMEERGLNPDREKESIRHTTRYRGITHLLRRAANDMTSPIKVLEFGCAHGHITNLLAEEFPSLIFVGMDFMDRSIKLATQTAEARGLKNVTFQVGSLEQLPAEAFDVIIAPEVVEHIWDHVPALEKLMAAIKEGGELIITTPNGRWEWSGRDWWPKGREHLHHFERADIEEMFAEFPRQILHGPSGHELTGAAVGSWVYAISKVAGSSIRGIDYGRKLELTAPRDTVSLCMIVRDAEQSITRAILSVVDFVDEVVIALDPNTRDRTRERLAELQADFPQVPFKVFEGKSPIEIGFDAARNRTIDESCGDWILWIDADEEVIGASNIVRLLRPGAFNAYSIAQHHMSRIPTTVIAVDYPCRLFRRDSGARFYGVVHEHPEVKIGSAVPHTHMLGDVSILHHGYVDEKARRGRFHRNLPLLMRDIEQNPDRIINKFLYLRDLSQSIAFEGQQTGDVSQNMVASAHKAIDLFDVLIDTNPMMRMTLDAVPYYSTAVATLMLPSAFHARISVDTKKDELPGVKAEVSVEGLFHNREIYKKLLARIAQETTVNYDEAYL